MKDDSINQYDDTDKGGFSYEEKLQLAAGGGIDPKEIGLVSAEEAKLQIMPEPEPPVSQFGSELSLKCGVIPLRLQAEWAYSETKIIIHGTDKDAWIERWIEDNKHEYRIQGAMVCGNVMAQFERTFKDPILGMAQLLKLAGEMLVAKYVGEISPPATDREDEPTKSKE